MSISFRHSKDFLLLSFACLVCLPQLASAEDEKINPSETTVTGAAKFVYLNDPFGFKGHTTENCASDLAVPSTFEPNRLRFPRTLGPGTTLFAPFYATGGIFRDTFLSVQNVGEEPAVVTAIFFDESENLTGCDSAVVDPGSSHTFDAQAAGSEFGAAIILSNTPEGAFQTMEEGFGPCALFGIGDHFKDIHEGFEKGIFTGDGPLLTGQVQLIPEGSADAPVTSTIYNMQSNEMGDHDNASAGDYRYMLPRIVHENGEVATLIALFNTEASATIYDLHFQEEVSGAIVHSATVYLTGFDVQTYSTQDFFQGADFHGALILEASQSAGTQLAVVAIESDLSARILSSHLAVPLQQGLFQPNHSNYAISPVLYEPGWEMETTLVNLEVATQTLTVERFSSTGESIDLQTVELGPERTATLLFPDPGFGSHPEAGFVQAIAQDEIAVIAKCFRRDGAGTVVETISYNLHDETETTGASPFGDKGAFPAESGGADILALPLASKGVHQDARNTEILLTNLNFLPGQTAVAIHVYDQAGLRDMQCMVLNPFETRRIPVDFPALGDGANASLVIQGVRTNQNPIAQANLFENYALAAVAVQRTITPEVEIPAVVSLTPGGNDVGMAYAGSMLDPSLANTNTAYFPRIRSGTGETAAIDVQTTLASPFTPTKAGFVFFDDTGDVAGTFLSTDLEFPGTFRLVDTDIPPAAHSAAAFTIGAGDAVALDQLTSATSTTRYAEFLKNYVEGAIDRGLSCKMVAVQSEPAPDGGEGVVLSAYEGLDEDDRGVYDPVFGGFAFVLPWVPSADGFDSRLSFQNASIFNSGVEVIFIEGDEPKASPSVKSLDEIKEGMAIPLNKQFGGARATTVSFDQIKPGQAMEVRVSDHVEPGFRGVAILRSNQPLATMASVFSGGSTTNYTGGIFQLNYLFIPGVMFSVGSEVAYAPLAYLPEDGWETDVHVQNLSGIVDAKVRLDFFGPTGKIIDTRTGYIPPGRSARFAFEALVSDPNGASPSAGWIQITSEEVWREGNSVVFPSNIVGVVHLVRRNQAGCVLESIAYNTQNEQTIFDWPSGQLTANTFQLMFPSIVKGLGTSGNSTELALANVNPNTGEMTVSSVRFIGEGFTTLLSNIVIPGRNTFLLGTGDAAGIPPGSRGSLSMSINPAISEQAGGSGLAGIAVHRALGLLPHPDCIVVAETPTATSTTPHTPTHTGTASATIMPTLSFTPSSQPTATSTVMGMATSTPTHTLDPLLPTPTQTASPTATATGTLPTPTPSSTESERDRADINRDGKVDALDQLILLKHWMSEGE